MRAMRLQTQLTPLQMTEVNSPSLGLQQVRIAVSACGVCRTDLHVVDGELSNPKLPIVPGHEIVGRIKEVGADVIGLKEGDRVGVPWLGWTCGRCEFCLRGQENLCPQACFTGYHIDGGFAEETTADSRYVFPLPASYSDESAAPLLCAGLIGWRALNAAGDARKLGVYGFGAAAHIVAQAAKLRNQEVYAFVRPNDRAAEQFAYQMGAVWAGRSDRAAPDPLDAAIIFARLSENWCPPRCAPFGLAAPSFAGAFI